MSLPQVIINITNGGLGGVVALADGIAGLIVSGDANPSAEWTLGTAKQFFSIDEVKDAGLNPAYDTANTTNAYKHVADFFTVAGDGAELWVMVVPKTETMEDIADATSDNAFAKELIDASGGTIRLLGITRVPDAAYVATVLKGIDDDVIAALTKLEALADSKAAVMEPFIGIVEGRDYQGVSGDLEDLKGLGFNRVGAVICGDETDGSAAVGLLLGRLASDPVMRKPGRVKTGAIPVVNAFFTDGTPVSRGIADTLDTLGWIVMTTYPQRSGFYWGIDNTCSAADDDFSTIVNRRVIDKAMLIAYNTYVTELMDEIEIDPETGRIAAGKVAYYQGKIDNALALLMQAGGEVSGGGYEGGKFAYINPAQNVLSTGKVVINLKIVPVGYSKTIEVNLGFSNPAA
ncbi:MAG: DUF2586 family protein [Bacteroidales bacterium]|nr:DUF2586 family protein [Bacteroidales bacterium]